MNPTIVILTNKRVDTAPRVVREIASLSEHATLILIGEKGNGDIPGFYELSRFRTFSDKVLSRLDSLFSRNHVRFSGLNSFLQQQSVSVIIVHEPQFVPLAVKLKQQLGCKVVFNAHEYHPREFEDNPDWMEHEAPKMDRLYKTQLKQVDLLINVCETIRQQCLQDYQLDSVVIPNAAFQSAVTVYKNPEQSVIRLIHHGAILPGRKIEKMIVIAEQLGDGYELDIMGMKNPLAEAYYRHIETRCAQTKNVRLIPPVPFDHIIPTINKYDIGLYLLEPSNFNNFNALPNKLFEFIQAKLAIAVSPSPEMKRLVEQYDLGVVSSDFEETSMVRSIKGLTKEDIRRHKENALKASTIENAEKYQEIFSAQIVSLTH